MRAAHESPPAIAVEGWRYHHMGIPTTVPRAGEQYLEHLICAGRGLSASKRIHSIQSLPHMAFEVDDLDAALAGKQVLVPPGSPSAGVRAAMFVDNGALIELIEFRPPR